MSFCENGPCEGTLANGSTSASETMLRKLCFGNYASATMLRKLCFGNYNYASETMLRKPCFGNQKGLLRKLCFGNYGGNYTNKRQVETINLVHSTHATRQRVPKAAQQRFSSDQGFMCAHSWWRWRVSSLEEMEMNWKGGGFKIISTHRDLTCV